MKIDMDNFTFKPQEEIFKLFPKEFFHNENYREYFEILNDNLCCIRIFYSRETYANSCKPQYTQFERIRVFISKTGQTKIYIQDFYDYLTCSIPKEWSVICSSFFDYCYDCNKIEENQTIVNMEELQKWEPISRIYDIINKIYVASQTQAIVAFLRYPILERLCKAGYVYFTNELISTQEPTRTIHDSFGITEIKQGKLVHSLNTNKTILNFLEEICREIYQNHEENHCTSTYFLKSARIFLQLIGKNIENLSTQDLKFYYTIERKIGLNRIINTQIGRYKTLNCKEINLNEQNLQLVKHIIKLCKKDMDFADIYSEILRNQLRLPRKYRLPIYELTTKNRIKDFVAYHDLQVQFLNDEFMKKEAKEKKARYKIKESFNKLQSDRIKKYNYQTENDNYLIRVPNEIYEINNEGYVLGHCVGSYSEEHALGNTNIIFLRKKENPNTPFFTIEVKNNTVLQIHGKSNRWLGTEKEAVPFVIKWLKNKNIKCDKSILLNTSYSYSMNNNFLDETEFDLDFK